MGLDILNERGCSYGLNLMTGGFLRRVVAVTDIFRGGGRGGGFSVSSWLPLVVLVILD